MNNVIKITKASFRECPISDRKTFSVSSCIVPISVGQKVHEGEKFLATIDLINSHFKSCVILIDDSVQRHTLKITDTVSSESQLYEKAMKEGDLWIGRNEKSYTKLTIPYKVIRWDKWLRHNNFAEKWNRVNNLYNSDESYKKAIDVNIGIFLCRYLSKLGNKDNIEYQHAFNCCLNYCNSPATFKFL